MDGLELIITPSEGFYDADSVYAKFTVALNQSTSTITNLEVVCPGAGVYIDNVTKDNFGITLPENMTTQEVVYTATVTVTTTTATSTGINLKKTVKLTQRATYLQISKDADISYAAGNYSVSARGSNNLEDSAVFAIPTEAQVWIKNMKLQGKDDNVKITFDVTENTDLNARSALIGVSIVKNNMSIINTSFTVRQEVKTDVAPIWKDYIWNEETLNEFIEYHLNYKDDILYAGKAYKYPGSNAVEFLLNDVSENFLSNGITFKKGTQVIPDYLKEFILKTSTGKSKPVVFFNDWSYEDKDTSKGYFLSDPINNLIDKRQYFVNSWILPTGEGQVTRTIEDGPATDVTLKKGVNGYTYVFPLKDLIISCGENIKMTIDGNESISYKMDDSGKNYVLYYVNAFGGWDSLLVRGNVKKTDKIESQTYVKKALNTTSNFSTNKYLNTISADWILYSGYLNDKQSNKMHHLLESTMVYLHNLEKDELIPVIITNTSCEYKTYTNQGKNMFYYTIEVQSSQDKYRK